MASLRDGGMKGYGARSMKRAARATVERLESRTLLAGNLIANGDFSLGNSGFTNDYIYGSITVDGHCVVGYDVADSYFGTTGGNEFRDHTTGTGQMLMLNGRAVANSAAWVQSVSVSASTPYTFSGWAASWGDSGGTGDPHPASLLFQINGVTVGTGLQLPSTIQQWMQWSLQWNSGSATTAVIRIVDTETNWYGNDFTMDDLSLSASGPANHAPTGLGISGASVAENQPIGTSVGTLSTTDPDVGDTFTYSLVSGTGSADNASFTIAGNQLQTAAVFNYEVRSSYSIRLRTTDQGGLWYEKPFTITVTDANDNPTGIVLTGNSIAENQPAGTVIGSLSGFDPDAGQSASLTYSLPLGYADNSQFDLAGDQLIAKGTLNYESKSSYSIQIRATDTGGLSYDRLFTITVTNVNETPTNVALAGTSVAENLPAGATVGGLSGSDPDAGELFSYALVSGVGSTDNASFTVSGSRLKTAAVFDYETRSSYSIRLRVTDLGGLWYEKPFTITVTNVNETPTDVALAGTSVAENQPAGTMIGGLSGSDPDAGQSATLTYSLPSGQLDNSLFLVVGNELRTNAAFNYESKNSYWIQLRATDTGGLSYDRAFAIGVTDVNDNPTDIALAGTSIAENLPAGTVVGDISGSDPDVGQSGTLTFGLLPGYADNSLFEIAGNQLTTASRFDYEAKSSYSIGVRATDTGGLSYDESFSITVSDDPTDLRATIGLVNGKTVASPALQDADGDLVKFKLSGGGTGQIYGFGNSFEDIVLDRTGTKSVLTITVKKAVGGDGHVTVGNMTSDGLMKSIAGTPVTLSGQMLLNTLNRAAGRTAVSLKLLQVCDANIQVQGLPVASLRVSGDVSGSRIVTTGSINTFSAATLLNSDVLVGVATGFAGDFADVPGDFASTGAKLGSLKVTGRKLARGHAAPAYVEGGHISAPNVGTVSLLNVPQGSGPVVHVLNDVGVLKVGRATLTSTAMVASGTWKVAGARPVIWEVV